MPATLPALPAEPGTAGGVSAVPPDDLGGGVITCQAIDGSDGLTAKLTGSPAGGSLQSRPQGTTLVLEAGGQWFTPGPPLIPDRPFFLPKVAGPGWSAIRSSAEAQLIAAGGGSGRRINPVAHAQYMPRILSTGQSSTFNGFDGAAGGPNGGAAASGIRLVGLELGVDPAFDSSIYAHYQTLTLGTLNITDPSGVGDRFVVPGETMSQRHIVERCWIHANGWNNRGGGSNANHMNRGIEHSGADCSILGCWIEGYQSDGQNCQCFHTMGFGPYFIDNCYLCSLGQCIMPGGTFAMYKWNQPGTPIIVPTGIIVRRSFLNKLAQWDYWSPAYQGSNPSNPGRPNWAQQVIANFELKFADRVLFEKNHLHNSFGWFALTNDSIDPQDRDVRGIRGMTITNITYRANLITDAVAFFQSQSASNPSALFHVHDNLAIGINADRHPPGGSGPFGIGFRILMGSDPSGGTHSPPTTPFPGDTSDFTLEHNTVLSDWAGLMFEGSLAPVGRRLLSRYNVMGYGTAGIQCQTLHNGAHATDAFIDEAYASADFDHDVYVNGPVYSSPNNHDPQFGDPATQTPFVPYSQAAYGPAGGNAAGRFILPGRQEVAGIDWETGALTPGGVLDTMAMPDGKKPGADFTLLADAVKAMDGDYGGGGGGFSFGLSAGDTATITEALTQLRTGVRRAKGFRATSRKV
jgi:hypothetical protein